MNNPATNLPRGTVTFLFTDIQGSTPLWEREPDLMRAALTQHNAILHQAVAAHHGFLFKTIGDAIQAAFARPADGLAAALAAQRELEAAAWPTSVPLRVRMGLHTGPAEPEGAEYAVAHTLNRVARIMSAGHGGQVVVSAEVAQLVRGDLPPEASLRDLGQHRMKGMTQREHLFELLAPGLPTGFPPLATLDATPNNLPVQLTSFVGRETEIAEARRLLASTHLLTLTGPGGTGKTRLSLQLASEVLLVYTHGAWLVELAPLADPDHLAPAVASALHLRESPGQPVLEVVTDYLRAKRLLLVLDNCEHLIEPCAQLADDLLHACPALTILASSREALGLAGETAYRVPSLPLPEAKAATPASLEASAAARLFVERARAAQPRFALTEANAPAVAAICRRLDGIPLALELAAARVRVLPVEQILARLGDRFRLLVGGSRTALPRQQTLRALIDWSYDLLPEEERRLLRELSVFVGGGTLEAVEAVGGAELDVLDLLTQLINKSLVTVEEDGPTARYRLLETIRQYAREKLLDAPGGEAAAARDRHLAFYLHMAEAAEPRLIGADMIAALDELEEEQDNLRAALEWALDHDPLSALRMVAVLWWLWARRTTVGEGQQWVQAALERAEGAPNAGEPLFQAAQARALAGAASMVAVLGDYSSARAAAAAGIALARQANDPRALAMTLSQFVGTSYFLQDEAAALEPLEECESLCRQHGFHYELTMLYAAKLVPLMWASRPVPHALREETLNLAHTSGNPWVIAMLTMGIAGIAALDGDYDTAHAGYVEAGSLFQQMRDRNLYTATRSDIGHLMRRQGRYAEALAIYAQTLRVWQELGRQSAAAHDLECLAYIAVVESQLERAARLFGAAEALREGTSAPMSPLERLEYDESVTQLRAQAEPAMVDAAWARGRALSLDEAITYALSEE